MPTLYKICDSAQWRRALETGALSVAGGDARDGFVHLSSVTQVRETADQHFAGARDLMLLAVDADAVSGALRWEPSRAGDVFPHLYGELPLNAVIWAKPLPLDPNGHHVFPELDP